MRSHGRLSIGIASVLYAASVCTVASGRAQAADSEAGRDVPVSELRKISVSATRGPRELQDIVGTVTVKDEAEIVAELANDIKDLIRYEPGVSVSNAPARFGLAGFNIRGIEGNRVLIRIDGVRMADAFAIGDFSSARRNLVDVDALKSVEIIRGAASALYGSSAIGGVVSFETKDPRDYLGPDRSSYVSTRAGYHSDDEGWFANGTLALGNESLSGMLLYTHRKGNETDNQGDIDSLDRTRTEPNPHEYEYDDVIGKLVWEVAEGQQLRFGVEHTQGEALTNVLSNVGVGTGVFANINTLSLNGDDEQERTRFNLTHEIEASTALFDSLQWTLYHQQSEVQQRTVERRFTVSTGASSTVQRNREFLFEQELSGGEMILHKSLTGGAMEHLLTYGIDVAATTTEQLRNGVQTNLATGATTSNISPDNFPVRDFPNTDVLEYAVYVQDEISIANGVWTLVPSVRVDRYELDPNPDAIFTADNPGVAVASIEETSVSPKLGLIRSFGENLSAFVQYARGFRAPPYNDVNIGFTNFAFGYTAIANPDLEPETSNGYEIGVRGSFTDSFFALTGFYNDYEDFIESMTNLGVQDGLQVFQSRNLAEARIYGVELRAGLGLATFADSLANWKLKSSIAYARGDDRIRDVPLNSVDPLKAVLGLVYEPEGRNWGVELIGTAVDRKSRVDESTGQLFIPPGYVTVDLLAHANIGERLRINAGVFNLPDRKYWDWSDVRGRPANDAVIDRFTRPGVNASVSASVSF